MEISSDFKFSMGGKQIAEGGGAEGGMEGGSTEHRGRGQG